MNVTELYHYVIEDVVKNLKVNCTSAEEELLQQLQTVWEGNLLRSGVIGGSSSVSRFASAPDVDDVSKGLNTSAGNPNEEENVKLSNSLRRSIPTMVSDLEPSSTSFQTHVEIIYPAIVDESVPRHKFPLHIDGNLPARFQPTLPSVVCFDGKPLPFMPPAPKVRHHFMNSTKRLKKKPKTETFIAQFDGLEGIEESESDSQDTAIANALNDDEFAEMFAENTKEEDIEPLNSDLDDKEESELETSNLVLCQFEKISRSKNKRKCKLKDGIMHLDGKDYVFSTAVGECEF